MFRTFGGVTGVARSRRVSSSTVRRISSRVVLRQKSHATPRRRTHLSPILLTSNHASSHSNSQPPQAFRPGSSGLHTSSSAATSSTATAASPPSSSTGSFPSRSVCPHIHSGWTTFHHVVALARSPDALLQSYHVLTLLCDRLQCLLVGKALRHLAKQQGGARCRSRCALSSIEHYLGSTSVM